MLFSEELLEIWGQPHWGRYWPLASFLGDQNAWAAEKKYLCCIWASAHSVIKALSLFFVLIEFTFSLIWTVQPRSDCPASASGLGWTTIRPWLDSPDLGKWKFYRDKETSLSSFVTSEQSFKCSTEHLLYSYTCTYEKILQFHTSKGKWENPLLPLTHSVTS